jgi:hypothetical protein
MKGQDHSKLCFVRSDILKLECFIRAAARRQVIHVSQVAVSYDLRALRASATCSST